MKLNYLAFAVPLFLFFIGLEYLYARRRKKGYFHFEESVANLNVGMAERLTDLFTTGSFYFLYDWISQHFALFSIRPGIVTWVLLFFATDFVWYWYHRLAHEVNLFWAAHVVHHQSEDFNYTTSTRITMFQAGIRGAFWAILPLIGFPPGMIAAFLLVHGAYPFFTHTQTIGKLGWLEYIFVTPSHHRVHHASNPGYLDRNYGDILIIWDKLFGTYAEEREPMVYGLTKPLHSYSFFWQHFHHFLELAVAVRRERGWKNKWNLMLGKPERIDPRIRTSLERKLLRREPSRPRKELRHYIQFQTALTLLLLFLVLLFEHYLTGMQLTLAALFLLVSIVNNGALLEKKQWIFYLEILRLSLLILFLNQYAFHLYGFTSGLLLIGTLLYFRKALRARYEQALFG